MKLFKALQHIFKKAIRKPNEQDMSDKVKVGIVGLGRISSLHLEAYSEKYKLDAELAAVCDKNKKRAENIAKEYNIEGVYTNYAKFLKDENIDAVEILTPHKIQTKQTILAAEAGKHISL